MSDIKIVDIQYHSIHPCYKKADNILDKSMNLLLSQMAYFYLTLEYHGVVKQIDMSDPVITTSYAMWNMSLREWINQHGPYFKIYRSPSVVAKEVISSTYTLVKFVGMPYLQEVYSKDIFGRDRQFHIHDYTKSDYQEYYDTHLFFVNGYYHKASTNPDGKGITIHDATSTASHSKVKEVVHLNCKKPVKRLPIEASHIVQTNPNMLNGFTIQIPTTEEVQNPIVFICGMLLDNEFYQVVSKSPSLLTLEINPFVLDFKKFFYHASRFLDLKEVFQYRIPATYFETLNFWEDLLTSNYSEVIDIGENSELVHTPIEHILCDLKDSLIKTEYYQIVPVENFHKTMYGITDAVDFDFQDPTKTYRFNPIQIMVGSDYIRYDYNAKPKFIFQVAHTVY